MLACIKTSISPYDESVFLPTLSVKSKNGPNQVFGFLHFGEKVWLNLCIHVCSHSINIVNISKKI